MGSLSKKIVKRLSGKRGWRRKRGHGKNPMGRAEPSRRDPNR